jgi:hypothetical protein
MVTSCFDATALSRPGSAMLLDCTDDSELNEEECTRNEVTGIGAPVSPMLPCTLFGPSGGLVRFIPLQGATFEKLEGTC